MKLITKWKERYERWQEWCHYCQWNWLKKFLVLIGLKKSYWFNQFTINPTITREFYNEGFDNDF